MIFSECSDGQMVLDFYNIFVGYEVINDLFFGISRFREDSKEQVAILGIFVVDSSVVVSTLSVTGGNILFLNMQELSLQFIRSKLFEFST